jgi:membrane-bound ClpP family serine protease
MKTTFGKQNYQLLIGGIVILIIGYLLMIGGGSEDPNIFNPAIFDAQRLTIAPIFCLIGFGVIMVSIMWRSKTKTEETKN